LRLPPAVFKIFCCKHIGVTSRAHDPDLSGSREVGHVTIWPTSNISCRCSIAVAVVEILGPKQLGHDLQLSGSCDVIGHVTDHLGYFFLRTVFRWDAPFSHNTYVTDDRQTQHYSISVTVIMVG